MADIEPVVVTRWRCSTCRRSWSSKYAAMRHVKNGCVRDPLARACATCRHDHNYGDEHGAYCDLSARPDGTCARHCPLWQPTAAVKQWLAEHAPDELVVLTIASLPTN